MTSQPKQPILSFWPQLGFLAFFFMGLFASLWQQGDSRITLASLLLGTSCFIISRLSYKAFPNWLRLASQGLVALASFAWLRFRWTNVPMDLAVSEAAILLLCALFLRATLSDHLVLWSACIGLLAYGSMNATRSYFALFFVAGATLCVLLLYATRTLVLAATRSARPAGQAPGRSGVPPFYWLVHFAMVTALAFLFTRKFTTLPQWNTMGLVPVSFRTMQSQSFPGNLQDWFTNSSQYEGSDAGKLIEEALENGNPFLDPNSANRMNAQDAPATTSQGGGTGFQIGTDLVFQAYSPAKLYWMVQCYDLFDGTTWSRSPQLDSGANPFDHAQPDRFATVVQKITLYKPSSDYLPFCFCPERVRFAQAINGEPVPNSDQALIFSDRHLICKLAAPISKKLPKLPWHYTVVSSVALPPDELVNPAQLPLPDNSRSQWPQVLPPDARGYHFKGMHFTGDPPPRPRNRNATWDSPGQFAKLYLDLPENVVTDRMKELASKITAGATDDLEKAKKLRDYLRENYVYTLSPPPVPAGASPLDFFLFEGKSGFCQQFAQSLVFLARSVGLRSRLVTGYSPGNYNVLSNCYEVFEYHAHAWTQIFIERYGWLTFDGTPPGSLDLQNTPRMLAASRNAFDETWTPNIPELSFKPTPGTAVFSRTNPNGWNRNGLPQLLSDLFGHHSAAKTTQGNGGNRVNSATSSSRPSQWISQITYSLRNINAISSRFTDALRAFFAQPMLDVRRLVAVAILFAMACLLLRPMGTFLRKWHRRFRCRHALSRLKSLPKKAVSTRIEGSLALADRILDYVNLPRMKKLDATEHAASLASTAPDLQEDYLVIAKAALQNHFALATPETIADQAVQAVSHFLAIAYPSIAGKPLRKTI